LEEFANHIHLMKMIYFDKEFASESGVEATYITRTICFIYIYLKSCVWL